MSTLSAFAERHGSLEPADLEWLHLLVGDWQMISDLAFAGLVLWLPTRDGDFVAVAQVRPSTAPGWAVRRWCPVITNISCFY